MRSAYIIAAGIAGTSAFTLFSYLSSKLSGRNFKQPELIGKMIKRTDIDLDKNESQFAGWLMHYLIGIAFAGAYEELIKVTGIKPSIKNGAIMGALSGFPASATWHTSLEMHPAAPRKSNFEYYVELFLGHVVFGATCFYVLGNRQSGSR